MKRFLIISAAFAVLLAGVFIWYRRQLQPVAPGRAERAVVRIEEGMSLRGIADLLEEKKVIRSANAFALFARLHGAENVLQAGIFIFQKSLSVPEIVEALRRGYADEAMITIPEGFTVRDIDQLLAQRGLAKPGDVVRCANACDFSSFTFLPNRKNLAERGGRLEGYLFPDTYFLPVGDSVAKFFLERMLSTFEKKVLGRLEKELRASPHLLHEVITMASLVEKETRSDAERPIVAGILWKRLQTPGMRLDVDAAVRYILSIPASDPITAGDLNVSSSYNVRKLGGLPPGPIANPGLASIRATLFPKETEYWYYLHEPDGMAHFAKTNEEHNTNKYRYLR